VGWMGRVCVEGGRQELTSRSGIHPGEGGRGGGGVEGGD
jgi:hypothetical protein